MACGAKQSETSEIVGAVSKFVGAFVGTVATVGRKFTCRSSKSTAPVRRLTLSGRVTALESGLTAVRRDVDNLLGKGKTTKQKKKSPTKGPKDSNSTRQKKPTTSESSKQSRGKTTAQENQPPRKDAQTSKNGSSETDTSPDSAT